MYRNASSVLLLLLGWSVASAAPMASIDATETATPKPVDIGAPAPSAQASAGGAIGIPQSRTVELLLQMQDQSAASSAGGSAAMRRGLPARAAAADVVAAPAEETPLGALKSAIANSPLGTTPGDAAETSDQAQRANLRMEPSSPLPAGTPKAAGEPTSSLLNQPVIRFIRENRALTVLGGALVLAAVWVTATFSSSRRSRSRSR